MPQGQAAPFGVYVHIPFCSSRCGYCDFNTYTASELGDLRRDAFHEVLISEVALAADRMGRREVDTVFFGGGTPSLIGADALNAVLAAIGEHFALASDAEVTTEANPDSVDAAMLDALRAGGFTRISLGMQSSAPGVLRTLERTHTPGRSAAMARAARAAGFDHVNLDLIYGTPGETEDDLRTSLDEVLDADVDHVSAYALIVEDGTPLARRVRNGEIAEPDDDVAAARYELVDDVLTDAGLTWYEVSNWARPGGECRHNLAYWNSTDWWGIGPGAHSHRAGERWWNAKHPATYARALAEGRSPEAGRESLDASAQRIEAVMLGIRRAEGLSISGLDAGAVDECVGDGLAEVVGDRLILTRRGRLLANRVITRLTDDE